MVLSSQGNTRSITRLTVMNELYVWANFTLCSYSLGRIGSVDIPVRRFNSRLVKGLTQAKESPQRTAFADLV